jgi:hypothetical protein
MLSMGRDAAVPAGLVLASRRRRMIGTAIDVAVFVTPWLVWARRSWRRDRWTSLEADSDRIGSWFERQRGPLLVTRTAMSVLWFTGVRTPGFRIQGLRYASVKTGAAPLLRQATLAALLDIAVSETARRINARVAESGVAARHRARLRELQPQIEQLLAERADDETAPEHAVAELLQRERVNPLVTLLPAVRAVGVGTGVLLLTSSFMPWSARRQRMSLQVAGIIVVRT